MTKLSSFDFCLRSAVRCGFHRAKISDLEVSMRVLIVEDEAKTAAYLAKGLREHGFVADVAHDGRDGLHLSQSHSYDVAILDVRLPGLDGWTVLRDLRASGSALPVLFLTACDDVPDRSAASNSVPMITLSNRLPFPNCWRGSGRSCAAGRSTFKVCPGRERP